MKERPILFNGAMVRALLDGTKTQTRRACKPQPVADSRFAGGHFFPGKHKGAADISVEAPYVGLACPFGQPGDRLWVRESCWIWGLWKKNRITKSGRQKWRFNPIGKQVTFDQPDRLSIAQRDGLGLTGWVRRPSIHMPSWASRITLEITEVRVERLNSISDADAWAEGIDAKEALSMGCTDDAARAAYSALWESINGQGSWDANPFVWCVSFKVLP